MGYEGSAWCDIQTLDLVRLEIVMREIPENLLVSGGRLAIDYSRVLVGRSEFLLPRSVDSTFTFNGVEGHNHTSLSGCRQYAVESGISFGELPANEGPVSAKTAPLTIPAGVIIESKLDTELAPARLAKGDPFEATVTRAAHQKSVVLAPKGARLNGHVAEVLTPGGSGGCVGVMLHPDWIEFEGRDGAFDAEQVLPLAPGNGPRHPYARCPWEAERGTALVFMEPGRLASSKGYPIVWRSLKPAEK